MHRKSLASARIAVVHEWLSSYAGSERVLEQILETFPHADVFSVADFLPPGERHFLRGKTPATSFIQSLPMARKCFRAYLPLMPLAVEGLDLSSYDVVISSSHAVAKGVLTGPDQLHVCYCHTPMRYAWDLQHQYLRAAGGLKRGWARLLLHYMRLWDLRTANGVDAFIANSAYIARRIRKVYGRDASVIYPPVDIASFTAAGLEKGGYYLAASRLVPYKRVELVIEAFGRMPHRKLVVAGDGPEFKRCQALAGANVEMAGHVPPDRLTELMRGARGFVFAAEEDFGIAVVEAQACGTPVICYGRGGATESVIPDETGLFFNEQTAASIVDAVERFETVERHFSATQIRHNAERFSREIFRRQFHNLLEEEWEHRHGFRSAHQEARLTTRAAR